MPPAGPRPRCARPRPAHRFGPAASTATGLARQCSARARGGQLPWRGATTVQGLRNARQRLPLTRCTGALPRPRQFPRIFRPRQRRPPPVQLRFPALGRAGSSAPAAKSYLLPNRGWRRPKWLPARPRFPGIRVLRSCRPCRRGRSPHGRARLHGPGARQIVHRR